METKELQKSMKETKPIFNLNKEEFNYSQKPVGKAIYKHSIEEKRKAGRPIKDVKVNPKDRLECDICGKSYIRSSSTHHKRTQYHQAHVKINSKLRKLLID
jgi:hypothetical protein